MVGSGQVMEVKNLDALRVLLRRKECAFGSMRAASEICKMVDEGYSFHEISDCISKHPGLAIRVIKVASTCKYGLSEIGSVERAVQVLGIRDLKAVVTASSLLQSVQFSVAKPLISSEAVCRKMVFQGMLARDQSRARQPR